MKKLLSTLFAMAVVFAFAQNAQAADVVKYKMLANDTIKAIVSGDLSDIDGLISKQEEMAKIGVELAKKVASENADGKEMLEFTIAHVDEMKGIDLDTMEDEWHHGHIYKTKGLPHDEFDHYGPIIGAKDAIVHPLSAYIALKAYKTDGDEEHLTTAQEELEEIIGQLEHVE